MKEKRFDIFVHSALWALFLQTSVFGGVGVFEINLSWVGFRCENDKRTIRSGTKMRINLFVLSFLCHADPHVYGRCTPMPSSRRRLCISCGQRYTPKAFHCIVLHPGHCSSHPV